MKKNEQMKTLFETWYEEGEHEITMLGVPNTLNIAYKQYRQQRLEKEKKMGYKEEQAILNSQTEVPCPGGGRDQRCKLNDVVGRSSLRTQKGEYKFKSSAQSRAKSALRNWVKYQEEFYKYYNEILATADITVKK